MTARTDDRLRAAATTVNAERPSGSDRPALPFAADTASPTGAAAAVSAAQETFGGIDVVVNCVGRSDRGQIQTLEVDHLESLFRANLYSSLHLSQQAMDALSATKGSIIHVGSLASKVAPRMLGGYCVAKHAQDALVFQQRAEWRSKGIHVGYLCPGPIAREDAGQRYAERAEGLPPSVSSPGGGTKVRGLRPEKVAATALRMIDRRVPEIILPGYLRPLIAAGQLSPRFGIWLLDRFTRDSS